MAVKPPEVISYDPENPPEGLFADEWMEVRLGGQKSGYSHMTLRRDGDVIHSEVDTYMSMARGAIGIEIKSVETTKETVNGDPLAFSSKMVVSSQPVITSGEIADGKVTITTESPGYTNTQTYPFPKGALMTWGLSQMSFIKGFKPGTEYDVLFYSPSLNAQQAIPGSVKILDEGYFDYRGTKMKGVQGETVLRAGATDLVTTSWSDPEGRVLQTQMDMMGMPMTMIVVDEVTALEDFVPPEFFISNLVSVNHRIPDDAKSVVYRLKLKDGKMEKSLPPESDFQKVSVDLPKNAINVSVSRPNWKGISDKITQLNEDQKPALKPNLIINSEDQQIVELAAKVRKKSDEKPLQLAQNLRNFVYDFIDEKSLSVGFASASEVADNPTGDCSEHAVLLAAMGRAENIPSRVAAGLLYLPAYAGQENIMGYHMWTQFYIGGKWLDFDAIDEAETAGPTRVALLYSYLEDESLASLGLELVDIIGQLEIEIVSVDGKDV